MTDRSASASLTNRGDNRETKVRSPESSTSPDPRQGQSQRGTTTSAILLSMTKTRRSSGGKSASTAKRKRFERKQKRRRRKRRTKQGRRSEKRRKRSRKRKKKSNHRSSHQPGNRTAAVRSGAGADRTQAGRSHPRRLSTETTSHQVPPTVQRAMTHSRHFRGAALRAGARWHLARLRSPDQCCRGGPWSQRKPCRRKTSSTWRPCRSVACCPPPIQSPAPPTPPAAVSHSSGSRRARRSGRGALLDPASITSHWRMFGRGVSWTPAGPPPERHLSRDGRKWCSAAARFTAGVSTHSPDRSLRSGAHSSRRVCHRVRGRGCEGPGGGRP